MAFMIPSASPMLYSQCWFCGEVYFTDHEETGSHCSGCCGKDSHSDPVEGWFGRLSAPGYMDATDWQGPFDRPWKALRAVCETYDVDVYGEDRSK